MADSKNTKAKSLFDEWAEAELKAKKEFGKLPPEEKKKKIKNSLRLQHRMDVENACMFGLPIPSPLSEEEMEAKANNLSRS